MRKIRWLTITLLLFACQQNHEFDYPLVFTGDVTEITDTSATFSAKVSNTGNFPVLESGFIWGVHPGDNNGIKLKNENLTGNSFTLRTNETLIPGMTYYVRGYIRTSASITYGREVTFKRGERAIKPGNWSLIYDNVYNFYDEFLISNCFTIGNQTFMTLEDGTLYSYDHNANTFKYILSDNALHGEIHSAVAEENAFIMNEDGIYRFDSRNLSLSKVTAYSPGEKRYRYLSFLIDDNIYYGLGSVGFTESKKDFWKYNLTTGSWTQVASFPGSFSKCFYSLCINKTGYAGGASYAGNKIKHELWSYNPEEDKWIKKEDLPATIELYVIYATNTDNLGYCLFGSTFLEYNPIFDFWEKKAGLEVSRNSDYANLFTYGNKIYKVLVLNPYDEKLFKLWVYEK